MPCRGDAPRVDSEWADPGTGGIPHRRLASAAYRAIDDWRLGGGRVDAGASGEEAHWVRAINSDPVGRTIGGGAPAPRSVLARWASAALDGVSIAADELCSPAEELTQTQATYNCARGQPVTKERERLHNVPALS